MQYFPLSVWPSSFFNFDLVASILDITKKSIRLELIILECSFFLTLWDSMPGVQSREVCQTKRTSPAAFGIPCQGYKLEKYAKLKERQPPAFGIQCQGFKVEKFAKLKEPHVSEYRNAFASMTNFQASPVKQISLKLKKRPPNHTVVCIAAGVELWITITSNSPVQTRRQELRIHVHYRTWGWREVQLQKAKTNNFFFRTKVLSRRQQHCLSLSCNVQKKKAMLM